MLLFVLNVNSISCLLFVQLVCAAELALLIFKFSTRGLNLESTHLLTCAATLFYCLDTDLKQIAYVSLPSIIFSSRLNTFKHKLFTLFLKFASNDCAMIVVFLFIVAVLEGN